jgi:transposase-like protein
MTAKEIAGAVGKDERTVRRWINQASDKMSGLSDKMSEAERTKKAADYTLEETCLIIEAGMGPDAAGIFRANAGQAKPPARPKPRAVTGAYLRELNAAYDKSIIGRDDWRRMAGLDALPENGGKQLCLPMVDGLMDGLVFYQRIAESGGLVNSDRDDMDALYRGWKK